jgi:hypothetical protein
MFFGRSGNGRAGHGDGFYISVAGPVTFKNAKAERDRKVGSRFSIEIKRYLTLSHSGADGMSLLILSILQGRSVNLETSASKIYRGSRL